ncbi:MAG: glycosyltransferase family 39 protein [Anaerolineae bacterium]|nr:MAG: glycosyltransferase family 39 protein [Anaerolineae bacterium]
MGWGYQLPLPLLVSLTTLIGPQDMLVRLPAFMAGILAIAVAYVLGKRVFNTPVGLLLAFLLASQFSNHLFTGSAVLQFDVLPVSAERLLTVAGAGREPGAVLDQLRSAQHRERLEPPLRHLLPGAHGLVRRPGPGTTAAGPAAPRHGPRPTPGAAAPPCDRTQPASALAADRLGRAAPGAAAVPGDSHLSAGSAPVDVRSRPPGRACGDRNFGDTVHQHGVYGGRRGGGRRGGGRRGSGPARFSLSLPSLVQLAALFGGGEGWRVVLYLALAGLGVIYTVAARRWQVGAFFGLWLAIPLLMVSLVRSEHFFLEKYIIFVQLPFLAFVAIGLYAVIYWVRHHLLVGPLAERPGRPWSSRPSPLF